MTDSLFSSTHAALSFAFNYSERQGAPSLLGRLSEKNRQEGKGLSGLDGAAQAGMIRREVSDLDALQRAVIVCKFARPRECAHCRSIVDAPERVEAIEALTRHVQQLLHADRPHLILRRSLVRRYFGEKLTLADLAKRCGVHQNTASNHFRKVKDALQKIERSAMKALYESLQSIVGIDD